jgi:tRNA dimethylallyltransferase
VVAIVGATATGKTAVGERVAARLGGEVVCADARQVFRELDVGTGKPTADERSERPHHLFEWLSLGEPSTAGRWAHAASAACDDCYARGVVPVLVGGSGLYLSALRQGLHPEPPKDPDVRLSLERECQALGVKGMHALLKACDPDAAAALHENDRQRVLRALEVNQVSGHTLGWWRGFPREIPLTADWCSWELVCEPATISRRIAARTQAMWAGGLLAEVRALRDAGHEPALRRLAAIGYDEAMDHLAGRLSITDAQSCMDLRTRQLAKRQRTWFRNQLTAEAVEVGTDAVDWLPEKVARSITIVR